MGNLMSKSARSATLSGVGASFWQFWALTGHHLKFFLEDIRPLEVLLRAVVLCPL
jgi:hypothetical protein